jgi:hypothetical protein
MVADYRLTVLGAVWKERGHDAHFEIEHYELNPLFQKAVAAKRRFHPLHLAATLAVTAMLWLLDGMVQRGEISEAWLQAPLAGSLTLLGAIVGRHLTNLLMFRRIARAPGEIAGKVRMSHELQLRLSLYQVLGLAVPLALLALAFPTPHVLGAFAGAALLVLIHARWLSLHREQLAIRRVQPGSEPPPGP